jgi:hypothetical protein
MFKLVLIFLAGWFFGMLISRLRTDDSDKGFFHRSGFYIRTDHKTGLQYIEGTHGGIYPRLDENGKHLKQESVFND